eukprot:COSAG01_NODE_24732_length_768_cov_3.890882_1_plen_63_part_10
MHRTAYDTKSDKKETCIYASHLFSDPMRGGVVAARGGGGARLDRARALQRPRLASRPLSSTYS